MEVRAQGGASASQCGGVVNRRVFAIGTALAAATLGAPSVQAQSGRPERRRVGIAVGGKGALSYLPLTIAEQLGYFGAEGLEVEISDFASGSHALQALQGGLADVVSGAYEHTITQQSKGQWLQAFVLQARAPQIALGVALKNLPHYRSVADLRGKKIGITAPGSLTHMMSNLVLARAGLSAGDVIFVGVGTATSALTALRSGQIDALCSSEPVMSMLEHRGEVRVIVDIRTLRGALEFFGGAMPASCLYAPIDFLQKYPNTVQALAHGIVHGLKWLRTAGPSDIVKTVPEPYLLGDRGLYLASFEKVRETLALDGVFPEDGGRTALRALASIDATLRVDKIDLARTWTNQYALRAKARFKA